MKSLTLEQLYLLALAGDRGVQTDALNELYRRAGGTLQPWLTVGDR